jgi:hypothetical protein
MLLAMELSSEYKHLVCSRVLLRDLGSSCLQGKVARRGLRGGSGRKIERGAKA